MIQDIAPHRFRNEYRPVPPQKDSVVLYYEEHSALMKRTATEIVFPTFADVERLNEDLYETCTYLFTVDDTGYYLVRHLNREPHSEFTMENTRSFGQQILSIGHLRGLQDTSCIGGIRHADIVADADIKCAMMPEKGCCFVNTVTIWSFRRSVRL